MEHLNTQSAKLQLEFARSQLRLIVCEEQEKSMHRKKEVLQDLLTERQRQMRSLQLQIEEQSKHLITSYERYK